jgi:formate-dependent nitrite reductase membrane component NrfD
MPRYAWLSYGGTARIGLAIVLLAVAAGVALAGTRLTLPVRTRRPGKAVANFMLAAWVIAITAFLLRIGILSAGTPGSPSSYPAAESDHARYAH